ncbi:MAG: hypothetical protein HYX50_06020 [Chloroflexi bacterium]|nr:hypothetical protein [Chloroflexota bacterium]
MRARALAWTMWAAAVLFTAAGLLLLAASLDAPVPDSWGFRGFTSLFALTFSNMGMLILSRRANTVGWILLTVGFASGLQVFAEEYAIYGLLWRPGSLPGAIYFAWYGSWIWAIAVSATAVFLPLLFPDGKLSTRSARVIAIAATIDLVLLVGGLALLRGPLNNSPFAENPFGIVDLDEATLILPLFGSMVVLALAATLTIVARYRRTRGAEREQIKWLAYGFGVLAVGMVISALTQQESKLGQYALIGAMLAIPFTTGIAIRRYRLYEIDVLINRTLVYGATSALLGATFLAAVIALQALLRPLTGGSEIAVAASTMLTLAAFQPLRGRVQDGVDRRFYRSRYDAARTLDSFAGRLRNEVNVDQLRNDLLDVIGETVRPAHAGVWLRR